MLHYTIDESSNGSHFLINTRTENIVLQAFQKLNIEELNFNSDFLQKNVLEMTVAKVATNNDCFCQELAFTIKHIFDFLLSKKDNIIIYLSVPENSLKHKLIERFIKIDDNEEFKAYKFSLEGTMFYFFFNEEKTSSIDVLNGLINYFKEEWGVEFTFE